MTMLLIQDLQRSTLNNIEEWSAGVRGGWVLSESLMSDSAQKCSKKWGNLRNQPQPTHMKPETGGSLKLPQGQGWRPAKGQQKAPIQQGSCVVAVQLVDGEGTCVTHMSVLFTEHSGAMWGAVETVINRRRTALNEMPSLGAVEGRAGWVINKQLNRQECPWCLKPWGEQSRG